MSNAENFQWNYKGLTFLDNNIADKFQCDLKENSSLIILCKAFQCDFSGFQCGWTFQCDFQCHILSLVLHSVKL